MNYFRRFLDSFRERATSVRVYIHSTLVFGEYSINDDEVHKSSFDSIEVTEENGNDRSVEEDGEDEEDEFLKIENRSLRYTCITK